MDVSIIIVNWNTRDILRNCLESIYRQCKERRFEVIVIDNASEDGSVEMIRREFSQVKLVANQDNKGFAAANNQGIALAKGRYSLLLNSDTVVLDDVVDKAVAFADLHSDAAAVGCRVLNPDHTWQPTCFMFPSVLNLLLEALCLSKVFPRNQFFGRWRMGWWDGRDVREVDVVAGCFLLVRRDAIDGVGLLDDSYFMYGEETDWCYRFRRAGWKVMYMPHAGITHLGGASSEQLKGPMCLQLRSSVLMFLQKHGGITSYFAARLAVSLFFLLRLPFWIMQAVSPGSRRKDGRQMVRTYFAGAWRALFGWKALAFRKQSG